MPFPAWLLLPIPEVVCRTLPDGLGTADRKHLQRGYDSIFLSKKQ